MCSSPIATSAGRQVKPSKIPKQNKIKKGAQNLVGLFFNLHLFLFSPNINNIKSNWCVDPKGQKTRLDNFG